MRQSPEFFGNQELALVYIAKKLNQALKLEALLTNAGYDYLVEADNYRGGVVFQSERVGAFFYVAPPAENAARELLSANGYRPWKWGQ
jgi:hypothetical protein